MELTYRQHNFSEADRLWLKTAAAERPFDPRAAKARLYGQLPNNFNPRAIDSRFYGDDRLTLLGIRVFRPDDPIFLAIERLLVCVRERIVANPKLDSITVQELGALTDQPVALIAHAINFLWDFGSFFSGRTTDGIEKTDRLWLTGVTGFDAILQFESIDTLLQQWQGNCTFTS